MHELKTEKTKKQIKTLALLSGMNPPSEINRLEKNKYEIIDHYRNKKILEVLENNILYDSFNKKQNVTFFKTYNSDSKEFEYYSFVIKKNDLKIIFSRKNKDNDSYIVKVYSEYDKDLIEKNRINLKELIEKNELLMANKIKYLFKKNFIEKELIEVNKMLDNYK